MSTLQKVLDQAKNPIVTFVGGLVIGGAVTYGLFSKYCPLAISNLVRSTPVKENDE